MCQPQSLRPRAHFVPTAHLRQCHGEGVGDAGKGQALLGIQQTLGRTLLFHLMFFLLLEILNRLTFWGFSSQSVSDSCALHYACPCPVGHGLIRLWMHPLALIGAAIPWFAGAGNAWQNSCPLPVICHSQFSLH